MFVMTTAAAVKRPLDKILAKRIGSLEVEILDALWALKQATSREVFEKMQKKGHRLEHATVIGVLKRLVKRGFVKRDSSGDVYIYSPVFGRLEVGNKLIDEIVDRVFQGEVELVLLHLLSRDDARDLQLELLDKV
jgi:predicted transcriptional regulator